MRYKIKKKLQSISTNLWNKGTILKINNNSSNKLFPDVGLRLKLTNRNKAMAIFLFQGSTVSRRSKLVQGTWKNGTLKKIFLTYFSSIINGICSTPLYKKQLVWMGHKCWERFCRFPQIGITEPRRVAVTTLANRVAEEMGSSLGQVVGYSIRLDECFDRKKTKIKFMTEGILVRRRNLHEKFI